MPEFVDWLTWRLVLDRVATKQEIDGHWDLVEVYDANILLDLREDVERLAYERAKRGG